MCNSHQFTRNHEIVSNGRRETDPKGTLPDGKVEGGLSGLDLTVVTGKHNSHISDHVIRCQR